MVKFLKNAVQNCLLITPLVFLVMPNYKMGLVIALVLYLAAILWPAWDLSEEDRKSEIVRFIFRYCLPAAILAASLVWRFCVHREQVFLSRFVPGGKTGLVISSALALLSIPGIVWLYQRICSFSAKVISRIGAWWSAGILALLCWLSQWYMNVYPDIDNYYISLVIDGLYSKNEVICEYNSPLVSWFVQGINWVLPGGDGFNVFLELTVFAGLWILLGVILERLKDPKNIWIVWTALMPIIVALNLFHMNYTTITGLAAGCSFCGILSCLLAEKARPVLGFFSVLTVLAASGLRLEGLLMMLPYIGLILLYITCVRGIRFWKSWFRILGLLALAVALILPGIIQKVYFMDPVWSEAISYSRSRQKLVDYPTYEFEQIEQDFIGTDITKNDYNSVRQIQLLDTKRNTAERIGKMAKAGRVSDFHLILSPQDIFIQIVKDDQTLVSFGAALVIMALIIFCCSNRWKNLLLFACSLVGGFLILSYFYSIGRLPARIILIPIFGCVFSAVAAFLCSLQEKPVSEGIRFFLCSAFLSAAVWTGTHVPNDGTVHLIDSFTARSDLPQNEADETSQKRIWSIFDQITDLNQRYISRGKLPSHNYLLTQLADGGWIFRQPYYEDLLLEAGSDDMLQLLISGDYLYTADGYRAKRAARMLSEAGYGEFYPEEVSDLDGFVSWRFLPTSVEESQTE